MRTLPILGGTVLAVALAGAVMAASPSPSPRPTATPAPTPAPAKAAAGSGSTSTAGKATTSAATSAAGTTSSGMAWSASIVPLHVTTGTASVTRHADGTGTILVTLKGLQPDARWTVDIDGGTSTSFTMDNRRQIAFRTGLGVDKVSSDTFRIHLTAAEMRRLAAEKAKAGFTVLVTDGANRSAAVFAAG